MSGAPEIVIRPYRPSDRATVIAMGEVLQDAEVPLHDSRRPGVEMAEDYVAFIESMIAENAGRIFLAETGGKAAGFVGCWIGETDEIPLKEEARRFGYICDLFVATTHRRRGVARRLLDAAEEHLAAQGARRVMVIALSANAPACATYRALGYRDYEITFEKLLDTAPD